MLFVDMNEEILERLVCQSAVPSILMIKCFHDPHGCWYKQKWQTKIDRNLINSITGGF